MPGKPRKNKQIAVDYKTHQELESEAIENDKTIKEVAEKRIHNNNEEKIDSLQTSRDNLKDKYDRSRYNRKKCEKKKRKLAQKVEKLKKQSGGKWENYEKIPRREFKEAIEDHVSGVGPGTTKKLMSGLPDKLKFIAPKDFLQGNE